VDSESFDDEYGLFDGSCQACDRIARINDLGLCEECDAKLDRDFVRARNWAYSASAFDVLEDQLEKLRSEVIKKYGIKFELLQPPE